MTFEITNTVEDMLGAAKGTLGKDWKKAKDAMQTFIENKKIRLEMLADDRISGAIDEDFFVQSLKMEERIWQSEMIALKILAEAAVERAANAALDVFWKAVKTVVEIVV